MKAGTILMICAFSLLIGGIFALFAWLDRDR